MNVPLLLWGHLVLLFSWQVESSCTPGNDLDGPKTAEELQEAINKATAGSIIELLPIEYKGDFLLNTKHSEAKVTLQGSKECDQRSTIIGSGAVLSVNKGIWTISNVDIASGAFGIVLKSPNNILEYIQIKNVETGIIIIGDGNTVRNSRVVATHTGIILKASDSSISDLLLEGKGIQIKSGSNNTLKDVSITGIPHGSTGVAIHKASTYNLLESISIDNGFLRVNGNWNTIHDLNGLATLIVEGDDNTLHDLNLGDFVIIPGDSNSLHDLNVKDSVIVKGNSNTLRDLTVNHSLNVMGQNNTLSDLSVQGPLLLACGNLIESYTTQHFSSPTCN